ncbi:BrnA antitoxin family protein [Tabrizicola sp.]|uniref:BrnA antitoxin family protein n=1 Tax=Tabrizicola sp. TaxID=2005166 RepID=UPI003F33FBB4
MVEVNVALDADVAKFFRSMGRGYRLRINEVLRSYMDARLAGVIRGAETLNYHRRRDEYGYGEPKPAFGEFSGVAGGEWEDEGLEVEQPEAAFMQQVYQRRRAADGGRVGEDEVPLVR